MYLSGSVSAGQNLVGSPAYLHTTVDESWMAVTSPFALTVMWKTSISSRFGVLPCPMILKNG
jgi:hypothetical protein